MEPQPAMRAFMQVIGGKNVYTRCGRFREWRFFIRYAAPIAMFIILILWS